MWTSASVAMVATNVVFMVLAAMSTALRLHVRKRRHSDFSLDDYFAIAACFFSAALAITNIVGVPVGGFGQPFEELGEEKAQTFLKILFVLQFWYIVAVALVKLSILCLYRHLFSISQTPLAIKIFMALVVGWLISFTFATLFQVWPLWCNWIACIPSTNYPLMYALCSATDIILDICILSIPIYFLRSLQMMNKNKKIGLGFIFGLGIFCTVASIARLVYTVRFLNANIIGDYAINFDQAVVNIIMWSGIEACASTICANLPRFGIYLNSGGAVERAAGWFRHTLGFQTKSEFPSTGGPKPTLLAPWNGEVNTEVNTEINGIDLEPMNPPVLPANAIRINTSLQSKGGAIP